MEMALRYFRENYVKWIHHTIEVVAKEIDTQCQELTAEENVCEKHLQHAI